MAPNEDEARRAETTVREKMACYKSRRADANDAHLGVYSDDEHLLKKTKKFDPKEQTNKCPELLTLRVETLLSRAPAQEIAPEIVPRIWLENPHLSPAGMAR